MEKIVAATGICLRKRLFLKDRDEVCVSHIFPYRPSPTFCASPGYVLINLEKVMFQFIWASHDPSSVLSVETMS